jgi:UDP-galactopyranose mutase
VSTQQKKNYVVGYTLDSAIFARELALSGDTVVYINTGPLGYPLDDIRDYISYEDVIRLKTMGMSTQFKKLSNSRYAFVPYEQLKFMNCANGLFSYPLNKSSFESAEEWEEMELCLVNVGEFRSTLDNATNFINIYKNFFPRWLYDSVLKYISINKWGGFRQSKFTRNALAREIDLSFLDSGNTGTVYSPVDGYKSLCEELLDHENITIQKSDIKDMRRFVTSRVKDGDVYFMDNRIDYVCNYTYGNFDRVKFNTERTNESGLDEFIDVSNGIVITPMKDYWCISNDNGDIIKVYSETIDTLNDSRISEISPTNNNKKLISEYSKLLKLYSGKQLLLNPLVITTIK